MLPTRRTLISTSPGLAAALTRTVRAAESSLTFAGPAGLFQDLYEAAVLAPFQDSRTGTRIFYYGLSSSGQALTLLRRQKNAPTIDVVLLDLPTAKRATEEGLLEALPPTSIREIADLAPSSLYEGIAGPALFSEPLVLLFDPAAAGPPATWLSLWNNPGERTVAIPAPPDQAGIAFTMTAARLFGSGNDRDAVAGGVNAIAELGRRVVSWDPRPDVYNLIADGGARFGTGWNMTAQVLADRRPGRLGVVFPAEGTISRVMTVNLVKGARRPDAARQLIGHVLSATSQQAMVSTMYLGPVNARARYAADALARTAHTKERGARSMPVDWVAVEMLREFILARWRDTIPAAG